MQPLVSVIIPNYNHAPYLQKRIDTILSQTWPALEVIILDDCSTDNSRAVIESYRNHPRIHQIVYNSINGGTPFKQWKKGIELANGEWINIAESDDWCEPTHIETIMNGLLQLSDCVLGFGQTLTVVNGNEIINYFTPLALQQWHDGKEFLQKRITNGEPVTAGMVVFKKSAYEPGLAFETYRTAGDQKFYMHIAHKGKVFESGCILHYCRRHSSNTNNRPENKWISRIESLQTFQWAKEKGLITDKQMKDAAVSAASFILRNGKNASNDGSEILRKEINNIYPGAFGTARRRLLKKDTRMKLIGLIQKVI